MNASPDIAEDFRDWKNLPQELMELILLKLSVTEILTSAQNVCLRWCRLCKEPSLWRYVDMRSPKLALGFRKTRMMCYVAVARSCGQLVDIGVGEFCTNELLKYIAHSSSQLKCLRLERCHDISDEAFIEAVAKLPLLEEIEMTLCVFSKKVREALGRCCPLLKTLKWKLYNINVGTEELAFATAQNLPEIRYLQLYRIHLRDEGLQAIVDGCPHLNHLTFVGVKTIVGCAFFFGSR